MKPEKILESDVLDIVFENRNKAYGAYELRKHYNRRINKALGSTVLLVALLAVTQSFKVTHKTGRPVFEGGPIVVLADAKEIKKEEPKKKQETPKKMQENISTANAVVPKVVPDVEVDKIMSDIAKMDTSVLSTEENPGVSSGDQRDIARGKPSDGGGDGGIANEGESKEEVSNMPVDIAEVMPQFPGGKEAFIKFMQKNLRQPEDFDEGQKLTVIAKFIVDAEGNIVDIDIIQNGRKDLDEEVMRVVRKMPRWNPGMQNGRKVPVYFKVPVTFVGPE